MNSEVIDGSDLIGRTELNPISESKMRYGVSAEINIQITASSPGEAITLFHEKLDWKPLSCIRRASWLAFTRLKARPRSLWKS
jgi:hypothetical protein